MPDGGYAAKQVGRFTRTRIALISLNPEFKPVVVQRDERTVIGTVVLRWCEHQGT
jgi:SOS-response transcriptional repressor LexA